jgi:glycosyltransferase involved in cell wall biosynthesis
MAVGETTSQRCRACGEESLRLPEEIAVRGEYERTSTDADRPDAAARLAEQSFREADFQGPETPRMLKPLLTALAQEVHAVPQELSRCGTQMERLADDVSRETREVNRRLQECLDRLDRITGRGKNTLAQVERVLTLTAETIQAVQPAVHAAGRCFSAVRRIVGFPRRVWRKGCRMIGLGKSWMYVESIHEHPIEPSQRRVALGEILSGVVLEQEIVCQKESLDQVALLVGTYRRNNTGQLLLAILDAEGQVLREASQATASLSDNDFCVFHFLPITGMAGKTLRLRVSSADAWPGNAVTLWARSAPRFSGLTYNGRRLVDAELLVKPGYAETRAVVAPGFTGAGDLLIITPDRLGSLRIGLAMRHWEIARTLAQAGLRVTLASTHPIPGDLQPQGFTLAEISGSEMRAARLAEQHAAVMVQGTVLADLPALRNLKRPIIADMVTPMHVESIETGESQYQDSLRLINQCLQRADFFVCGNERQRLYWLGMLTSLGRLSREDRDRHAEFRRLIDVVPFGIPDEPPEKTRPVLKGVRPGIGSDDFVLIWFGGIWNWLNPLPLIQAVHAAYQDEPRIKLFFSMYRKDREAPHAMAVRAKELCTQLGALDRSVFFNDLPIPFDQRADYLLESDLGVIIQAANFETQLSARTRALDYFWADLPLFINRGDEIATLVGQHGLGVVTETCNAEELRGALLGYARDRQRQQQTIAAVRQIKEQFRWSLAVRPLLEFCRSVGVAMEKKTG